MPRPLPSVEAYKDIIPYLQTALTQGYLQIEVKTDAQAIHMCHRMNRWRLIERERGDSIWDNFIFSRIGRIVVIRPREILQAISVKDAAGNDVALDMSLPSSK